MGTCDHEHRISAFYDGELTPAERAAFEAHLPGCAECAAALADFGAISGMIAGAPRPEVSQVFRRRLTEIPAGERDRTLARTTAALTAVAAGLLLAGTAWLWVNSPRTAPAPAWEIAAVVGEADARAADDPDVQLAAWVVGDLSSRRGR